jgi:Ca2+-binding EF-hand superfamily protein
MSDNKEGKKDGFIDILGLLQKVDANNDKQLDETEYQNFAKLIGLKTPYKDIDKNAKGFVEEAGLLKALGDTDANKDKKLDRKEFDKLNPAAPVKDDKQVKPGDPAQKEPGQPGADKNADAQQKAPTKPKYFDLNKDHMHGVTSVELTDFLQQFAGEDGKLDEKELGTMLAALGWDKAQFAQTFIKDLKPGMSAADIVDAAFRKLDADHSGSLVRGEIGDLVEDAKSGGGGRHRSARRHRARRRHR